MLIEFHRLMLADKVRAAAFHEALRRVIKPGETSVADIGAGTGILGFLARRLGAPQVHLVEHGVVLELAEQIAARNSLDGLQFWHSHSTDITDPPQVDVVVAEVLGNLALEENVIETLADARRFLKPGGLLIPRVIEQFVAPVTAPRLHDELRSWDTVTAGPGGSLDFTDARAISFDNVYVRRIAPTELLPDAAQRWDRAEFIPDLSGHRTGEVRWTFGAPAAVYGFALWWRCELVPGVELTTSPFAAPTHWDQVYLPILDAMQAQTGDILGLQLESETGGTAGIGLSWEVIQRRGQTEIARESHDLGRGYLGAGA